MNKREVILIGGKFHRKKVRIDNRQHTVRLPVPVEFKAFSMSQNEELHPIKYVEYAQVISLFGEYGIIPENVFIDTTLCPIEFLKNLVLDYTK